MNFNQALEKAMKDYYGNDGIASRVPIVNSSSNQSKPNKSSQTKEVVMTREQLESMTKKEINTALTPLMGGFQDLNHVSKSEMIDVFLEQNKKASTKDGNKSKKEKGPGVINTIIGILESGGGTKQEIHKELIQKFPERAPDSMLKTINAQLYRLKVKYNLQKEIKAGVPHYWIKSRA